MSQEYRLLRATQPNCEEHGRFCEGGRIGHLRSPVGGVEVVSSSQYIPRKYLGVPDDQFSSVGANVQGVPTDKKRIARLWDESNTTRESQENMYLHA